MVTKKKVLPVLYYATGAGWQTLGMASSVTAARRVVQRHLSEASRKLLGLKGWSLCVTERTPLMRELNGGPEGYIWSIGGAAK